MLEVVLMALTVLVVVVEAGLGIAGLIVVAFLWLLMLNVCGN